MRVEFRIVPVFVGLSRVLIQFRDPLWLALSCWPVEDKHLKKLWAIFKKYDRECVFCFAYTGHRTKLDLTH